MMQSSAISAQQREHYEVATTLRSIERIVRYGRRTAGVSSAAQVVKNPSIAPQLLDTAL